MVRRRPRSHPQATDTDSAAPVVKNQVPSGASQLSSWFGFNLCRTTVLMQPESVQREWRTTYDQPGILPQTLRVGAS